MMGLLEAIAASAQKAVASAAEGGISGLIEKASASDLLKSNIFSGGVPDMSGDQGVQLDNEPPANSLQDMKNVMSHVGVPNNALGMMQNNYVMAEPIDSSVIMPSLPSVSAQQPAQNPYLDELNKADQIESQQNNINPVDQLQAGMNINLQNQLDANMQNRLDKMNQELESKNKVQNGALYSFPENDPLAYKPPALSE